jgi:hypothetical protein
MYSTNEPHKNGWNQQQSVNELIESTVTGKTRSECLKPFAGKDYRLQGKVPGSAIFTRLNLIHSDFAAALIEHYAFEAKEKKAKAIFTHRKFAKMGIKQWIQGITGWKPPHPEVQLPDLHFSRDLIQTLTSQQLPSNAYRLCLHLHKIGQTGERPTTAKICKDLGIHRTTYHTNIHKLRDINALPSWFEVEVRKYPERIVRDWLHSELGGTIEAPTPYGLIDLLTDDSLIELTLCALKRRRFC